MDASTLNLVTLAGALAVGVGLGAAHFGSLWCSLALMRDGRAALAVVTQALRFASLAAALTLVSRIGAAPFLAAALGVLAAPRSSPAEPGG
jgi:F1F0 ATPase subunit 2